eukprot:TRINITY_DN2249_c0_g1_i1.p1 TRINITY_DN2249_c0_g1~~TRINITY_DN2249_c0_g1_i1.p1  ORF type:complete len:1743 (+),score=576.41 TRINITY_DN2249_c0_g1_i1:139-5367(+)
MAPLSTAGHTPAGPLGAYGAGPILSLDDARRRLEAVGEGSIAKDFTRLTDGRSRMSKAVFSKRFLGAVLPLIPTPLSDAMFQAFNVRGAEELSLDDFVIGVAILRCGTAEERIKFVFSAYADTGTGVLKVQRLIEYIELFPDEGAALISGLQDRPSDATFSLRDFADWTLSSTRTHPTENVSVVVWVYEFDDLLRRRGIRQHHKSLISVDFGAASLDGSLNLGGPGSRPISPTSLSGTLTGTMNDAVVADRVAVYRLLQLHSIDDDGAAATRWLSEELPSLPLWVVKRMVAALTTPTDMSYGRLQVKELEAAESVSSQLGISRDKLTFCFRFFDGEDAGVMRRGAFVALLDEILKAAHPCGVPDTPGSSLLLKRSMSSSAFVNTPRLRERQVPDLADSAFPDGAEEITAKEWYLWVLRGSAKRGAALIETVWRYLFLDLAQRPADPRLELDIIKQLNYPTYHPTRHTGPPGTEWCLVDRVWWESWRSVAHGSDDGAGRDVTPNGSPLSTPFKINDSDWTKSVRAVPKLDNAGLLNRRGYLRRNIDWSGEERGGQHYEVITPAAWRVLSLWYGAGPASQLTRRVIKVNGRRELELHPPLLRFELACPSPSSTSAAAAAADTPANTMASPGSFVVSPTACAGAPPLQELLVSSASTLRDVVRTAAWALRVPTPDSVVVWEHVRRGDRSTYQRMALAQHNGPKTLRGLDIVDGSNFLLYSSDAVPEVEFTSLEGATACLRMHPTLLGVLLTVDGAESHVTVAHRIGHRIVLRARGTKVTVPDATLGTPSPARARAAAPENGAGKAAAPAAVLGRKGSKLVGLTGLRKPAAASAPSPEVQKPPVSALKGVGDAARSRRGLKASFLDVESVDTDTDSAGSESPSVGDGAAFGDLPLHTQVVSLLQLAGVEEIDLPIAATPATAKLDTRWPCGSRVEYTVQSEGFDSHARAGGDDHAGVRAVATVLHTYKDTVKVMPLNKDEARVIPAVWVTGPVEDNHADPNTYGRVGLQNLTNTCYLNSTVQVLSHLRPLREYFVSGAYRADLRGKDAGLPAEFADLLERLWSTDKPNLAPRKFREYVGQVHPDFATNHQHDAMDLLIALLEALGKPLQLPSPYPPVLEKVPDGASDMLLARETWKAHASRDFSFLSALFCSQHKATRTCLSCGHRARHIETAFPPLSLPLPGVEGAGGAAYVAVALHRHGAKAMNMSVCVPQEARVEDLLKEVAKVLRSEEGVKDVRPETQRTLVAVELHRSGHCLSLPGWKMKDAVAERVKHLAIAPGKQPVVHVYETEPVTPAAPITLQVVHRRLIEEDELFAAPFRPQLFGQPLILAAKSGDAGTGADLYRQVWDSVQHMVPGYTLASPPASAPSSPRDDASVVMDGGEAPRYPFYLTQVSLDGTYCSFCDWYKGCIGCPIEESDAPLGLENRATIGIDWDQSVYEAFYDENLDKAQDVIPTPAALSGAAGPNEAAEEGVDLSQCLMSYFETNSGFDAKLTCDGCKLRTPHSQTTRLFTLPAVLVVQLKRFTWTASYQSRKSEMPVTFPLTGLDLAEFLTRADEEETTTPLSPKAKNQRGKGGGQGSSFYADWTPPATLSRHHTKYNLHAVVNHQGGDNVNWGHYFTYVRCKAESNGPWRWWVLNDSKTHPIAEGDVVSPKAYLLYYIRADMDRVACSDLWPIQPEAGAAAFAVPPSPPRKPPAPTPARAAADLPTLPRRRPAAAAAVRKGGPAPKEKTPGSEHDGCQCVVA